MGQEEVAPAPCRRARLFPGLWAARLRDRAAGPGMALTIRVRFMALLLLALLAVVAFALVLWLAGGRIDAMLQSQDGYRRLNDLAADMRSGVATAENLGELFVRDRDPAAGEAFRAEVARMRDRLDTMARLVGAGAMADAVVAARGRLDDVAQAFAAMEAESARLGLSDKQGLRARLNESTHAVERELAEWPNAGDLPLMMARMRLAERDYMLYGAASALGRHRAAATQFDLAIDGSPLPPSTREEFRRLQGGYAADLLAFAEASQSLKQQVVHVRDGFKALRPVIGQVASFARDGMAAAIDSQEAARGEADRLVGVVGLVSALAFLIATLVVARSVIRPVREIQGAMERLAGGDHAVSIPGIRRRDEIGDMARSVAVFKENAIAMVRLRTEQEAIRGEAEAVNRARLLSLAELFERAVKQTAELVADRSHAIRDTARRMAARSDASGSGSLAVAEAAEAARATVVRVADAVADLQGSVREIADGAAQAAEIAAGAVAELEHSTERITGLADLARRIDKVVALITEIAGRTNMLALNAAIEARRAGAAGAGFAIVADEVKHLAGQTAQATRDIAAQIAAIQGATVDTVAAIGGIGTAIRRMDGISRHVSSAVMRQGEAADKISRCVEAVIADTTVVSDGVVAVTQSAARYCGGAVGVMWAAQDLTAPAEHLEAEVDRFLASVRA